MAGAVPFLWFIMTVGVPTLGESKFTVVMLHYSSVVHDHLNTTSLVLKVQAYPSVPATCLLEVDSFAFTPKYQSRSNLSNTFLKHG